MNLKQQLEIQALVDGELAGTDAARVRVLVDQDRDARELFEELSLVKGALIDGERALAMPEPPDFYFSQIRRRIDSEERTPSTTRASGNRTLWAWFRGHLGTVAGTAAVVAAIGVFAPTYLRPYVPGELTDSEGEMSAMTYRSEKDSLTIVYLFDSSSTVEEEPVPEPLDK